MCAHHSDRKPNVIASVLQTKCPRCRRGQMYKHSNPYNLKTYMQMNETCSVCGQPFDIEVGFYYGTSYVSYAISIAICVATFIAWWVFIGFSLNDNRIFWWLGANAFILLLVQPWLMRVSRTIWLSFFVRYSKDWNKGDIMVPERTNEAHMGNW